MAVCSFSTPPPGDGVDAIKKDLMALVADSAFREVPGEARQLALLRFVQEHPGVELGYMTNAEGVQSTPNAIGPKVKVVYGGDGFGINRSGRSWFCKVVSTQKPFTTQPYLSLATLRPCVTVAAPVQDKTGELVGVVAVDIRCNT